MQITSLAALFIFSSIILLAFLWALEAVGAQAGSKAGHTDGSVMLLGIRGSQGPDHHLLVPRPHFGVNLAVPSPPVLPPTLQAEERDGHERLSPPPRILAPTALPTFMLRQTSTCPPQSPVPPALSVSHVPSSPPRGCATAELHGGSS